MAPAGQHAACRLARLATAEDVAEVRARVQRAVGVVAEVMPAVQPTGNRLPQPGTRRDTAGAGQASEADPAETRGARRSGNRPRFALHGPGVRPGGVDARATWLVSLKQGTPLSGGELARMAGVDASTGRRWVRAWRAELDTALADNAATALNGGEVGMGTVYFGPYYEEINTYDHEGYAARVMPGGGETSGFGGEYGWTGHIGYRARCECGWTGTAVYPVPDPDPLDSDEADEEWMREHIQPMVNRARRQTWPAWSQREATRAASAAGHIAAGRYADALNTLQRMRDDLDARMRTEADLHHAKH